MIKKSSKLRNDKEAAEALFRMNYHINKFYFDYSKLPPPLVKPFDDNDLMFVTLIHEAWEHRIIDTIKHLPPKVLFSCDVEVVSPPVKPQPPEPPKLAEVLLILFPGSKGDAIVGDLNERYAREYVEYGPERACRRYWAEAARSFTPLLWRTLCRTLKTAAVIDAVRRYFLG